MSQQKWYYINASMQKVGPVAPQALKVLVENGIISRKTTLVAEDGSQMIEAGKIPGLFPEVQPVPRSATPGFSPMNDPRHAAPVNPFPSGITAYDPFAAAAHQESFHRAARPAPASGPSGLFLGVVIGLVVFLVCVVVFAVAMTMTGKPADIVGETAPEMLDMEEIGEIESADRPGGRSGWKGPATKSNDHKTPRNDEDENPFVEIDAEGVETTPAPRPQPVAVSEPERKIRQGKRDTEEIVAESEGSVAMISGKTGSGSGFVVLPGIVATNSHVINSEKIDEIEVIFPSETGSKKGPFKTKLLFEDVKRDLAFLEIPTTEHMPLQTVQDYRFRRGQRVIAIGNPGRGDGQVLENAVSEGILSTQTDVEDQPYYQLSISINTGNSGGPVLTDEGDVLGVVTLKGTKTEGVAFCIPPDALNEAVDTVRRADSDLIAKARSMHDKRVPLFRGFHKLSMIGQVPQPRLHEFAREVIKDFEEAVQKNPDEAEAFLGRGFCRAVLGDIDGMIADFETAARLAPDRKEYAELRDSVKQERDRIRQLAASGGAGFNPMDRLERLRPGMGGSRPPEDSRVREGRYQTILKKENWTFNGKPIRGRIVGYEDGIVHLKPIDDENGELVKRYANRFSREDIADIIFYAQYNRIPLGNLRVR